MAEGGYDPCICACVWAMRRLLQAVGDGTDGESEKVIIINIYISFVLLRFGCPRTCAQTPGAWMTVSASC